VRFGSFFHVLQLLLLIRFTQKRHVALANMQRVILERNFWIENWTCLDVVMVIGIVCLLIFFPHCVHRSTMFKDGN
jgi:hypothetical protein